MGDSNLGPPGDSLCRSAEPWHTGMDQSCQGFPQSSQTGLTPHSNTGGETGPAALRLRVWCGGKSLAPRLLCPPCLSPLSSPAIPTWALPLPTPIPPTLPSRPCGIPARLSPPTGPRPRPSMSRASLALPAAISRLQAPCWHRAWQGSPGMLHLLLLCSERTRGFADLGRWCRSQAQQIHPPLSLILSVGNLSQLCSLRTGKSQTDPAPNFGVSFKRLKVDEMNQSLDLHAQDSDPQRYLDNESHLFHW